MPFDEDCRRTPVMRGQLERRHRAGALAALYLLWVALWFVIKAPDGLGRYTWDNSAVAAVTGLVAFRAAQRVLSPYSAFLVMQGIAHLLLAGSWWSYRVPYASSTGAAGQQVARRNYLYEDRPRRRLVLTAR